MKNSRFTTFGSFAAFCVLHFTFALGTYGQVTEPKPSAPRSAKIPAVVEKKLSNGMTVAVVQKTSTPMVTIRFLVKNGAGAEPNDKAGLANLTASMLTKGTATRSATEIAEAIEFLGGSINSGAGWNSSFVSVTVTSDKVDAAMDILADVILKPKFDEAELDLLKSQTLDSLTFSLKQAGSLTSYAASTYAFLEHPAGGTADTIAKITVSDVKRYYNAMFDRSRAVLIFAGDISPANAAGMANMHFVEGAVVSGVGSGPGNPFDDGGIDIGPPPPDKGRILVIDLPNSGQASVTYAAKLVKTGRKGTQYYTASVLNSVLGGGYSSRLNQEIRIKRGLSYGAGSSFSWRAEDSNFSTGAQTKNESAAHVAELILAEIKRLSSTNVAVTEMTPRKSVLTGTFGLNLETTAGLAGAVSDLYSFGIPLTELNAYVRKVNGVTAASIRSFAGTNLNGGVIIIAGDYSVFKDDLAKRFPKMKVDVIPAEKLDLSKANLRK